MQFFRSPIFLVTVLLQIGGPFLFGFGNWTNMIQYVSGFGMAYALWDWIRHRKDIQKIIHHIHSKEGSK